jgi:hypothetical protein
MGIARHVIGWLVTQETRIRGALDDVMSNICSHVIGWLVTQETRGS